MYFYLIKSYFCTFHRNVRNPVKPESLILWVFPRLNLDHPFIAVRQTNPRNDNCSAYLRAYLSIINLNDINAI